MTKIKVKLFDSNYPLVIRQEGDWIDLYTTKDIRISGPEVYINEDDTKPKRRRKVIFHTNLAELGVAMQLPEGYEAHVLPRSSTFKNFKVLLTNSQGIIDEAFRGDNDVWKFGMVALEDTVIPAHSRVAQFRIVLSQKATVWQKIKWLFSNGISIEYVDSLGNKDRGGIGSTGVS